MATAEKLTPFKPDHGRSATGWNPIKVCEQNAPHQFYLLDRVRHRLDSREGEIVQATVLHAIVRWDDETCEEIDQYDRNIIVLVRHIPDPPPRCCADPACECHEPDPDSVPVRALGRAYGLKEIDDIQARFL